MRRNRRLERMLREAAIAEELRRREVAKKKSPPPLENPYALWFPGFFLWEKLVFGGVSFAANMATLTFVEFFKATRHT